MEDKVLTSRRWRAAAELGVRNRTGAKNMWLCTALAEKGAHGLASFPQRREGGGCPRSGAALLRLRSAHAWGATAASSQSLPRVVDKVQSRLFSSYQPQ